MCRFEAAVGGVYSECVYGVGVGGGGVVGGDGDISYSG